jgi:DNA end-binding protein Ku
MAKAFLESLEVDFDPSRYTDDYQVQLAKLIERKTKEGDIAIQPEDADEPERTPAVDIMAALEASLQRQLDTRSKSRAASGNGSRAAASPKKTSASTKAKAKAKAKK